MIKSFKILGVFLTILLLTGCMSINTTMKINEDKSVDVNMKLELDLIKYTQLTFGFDSEKQNFTEKEIKEYLDEEIKNGTLNIDEFMSEEDKKEMEQQGYKVESNIDKENYIYYISLTQHFNNIDDTSKTEEEANKETDNNEIINKFFIKTSNNTYKFNLDFNDATSSNTDSNTEMDNYMNGMIGLMTDEITYKYEITLPNKTISNNATQISNDGKTLIWNLNANDKNKVEFEFSFPESPKNEEKNSNTKKNKSVLNFTKDKIIAIGLIAIGVLTIIITSIVFVTTNKKANNTI